MSDSVVRIAIPYGVVDVDGREVSAIAQLVIEHDIKTIVIGYPRNQSGDTTAQTAIVEEFAKKLEDMAPQIVFQDESLTSVMAEERLKARGDAYDKGDIDAEAAAIILQDYLETHS